MAAAANRSFPPAVAVHLVKLAWERPDHLGRSLSQWDCVELAHQLAREGRGERIAPEPVRRILEHHQLTPWRHHLWLSPHAPRDAEFSAHVADVVARYTRLLRADDMVLSLAEKTSLPPRPRRHVTRPAKPGRPNQVEHEYRRAGALNLFAAFDTRTGRVYGPCSTRKRQREFLAFLEYLDTSMPAQIKTIHIVCDNARAHPGTPVRAWLQAHRRFVLHLTPGHGSWLHQIEPWFSLLQRKRLRLVDFALTAD